VRRRWYLFGSKNFDRMIEDHNLRLTEQQYRDLEIPSYSMLASIEKQGVDVINGVKSMFNLKFGSLVDVMCFEPNRVKELFYQGGAVKAPTSTHKKVVDDVIEKVLSSKNKAPQSGVLKRREIAVTDDLSLYRTQIINSAIKNQVLKTYSDEKKFDTIVASSSLYFKDRISSIGKNLIKPEMWALALETVKTLKHHKFSAKYFNHRTPGVDIIYQFKFDTNVNNRRVKGMLDCLIVNHNAKVIIPVDLKTGEAPVKDFPMLYLQHRYYIQGALYREALKSIVSNDFDLTNYVVKPFEFLYISKGNPYKPMIFVVEDPMHNSALIGFTDRYGYDYRGVYDLLEDYYDCTESGFCDYTQDEEASKGRVIMDNLL